MRDTKFTAAFDAVFTAIGVRIVEDSCPGAARELDHGAVDRRMPPRASDRTLIWNLPHLRRILAACERHHNDHRPHMALSSAAPLKPLPAEVTDLEAFRFRQRDRVGGVIHEYQHAA